MAAHEAELRTPDLHIDGHPAPFDRDRADVCAQYAVGGEVSGLSVRELEVRRLEIGPSEDDLTVGVADVEAQGARQLDVPADRRGDALVREAPRSQSVDEELDVIKVNRRRRGGRAVRRRLGPHQHGLLEPDQVRPRCFDLSCDRGRPFGEVPGVIAVVDAGDLGDEVRKARRRGHLRELGVDAVIDVPGHDGDHSVSSERNRLLCHRWTIEGCREQSECENERTHDVLLCRRVAASKRPLSVLTRASLARAAMRV